MWVARKDIRETFEWMKETIPALNGEIQFVDFEDPLAKLRKEILRRFKMAKRALLMAEADDVATVIEAVCAGDTVAVETKQGEAVEELHLFARHPSVPQNRPAQYGGS